MTTVPGLFSNRPKQKGSRAKGLTYEKHVGRSLKQWTKTGELAGTVLTEQWFSFIDANGHGCCQTDILILRPEFIFILECKLTWTEWAWPQLRRLYKPVVERVFQRPAITVQVCKNLHKVPAGMIESIAELIDNPRDGLLTWHFLGR